MQNPHYGSKRLFPLEYEHAPDSFTKTKRTIKEGRFNFLVDVKFKNKNSKDMISKLEKEIAELKKSTDYLTKENENIENEINESEIKNQKLRKKSEDLCNEAVQMKDEIKILSEKIEDLLIKQEQIKKSMQQKKKFNVTPPRTPNNRRRGGANI